MPEGNFPVSKEVLDLFWKLAEGNEQDRFQAIAKLVANLKHATKSKGGKNDPPLDYVLNRLIKGTASTRKNARAGFSVALIQVLKAFPSIKTSKALAVVEQCLKGSANDTKQEQTNQLLGHVMTYLSLIQSERLQSGDHDDIRKVTKGLMDVMSVKATIRHVCATALLQLAEKVEAGVFEEVMWPVLKPELKKGWEECDPERLMLVLQLKDKHKCCRKVAKKLWGGKQVVCEENFESIADVLSMSTSEHPVTHGVVEIVLHEAMRDQEVFLPFWTHVEEKLFASTAQRKALALKMVSMGIKIATSVEQVKTLLSGTILNCLLRNLGNPKHLLHGPVLALSKDLVAFVKGCESAELQLCVIHALLSPPSVYFFDGTTRGHTVLDMTAVLKPEAAASFAEAVMGMFCGRATLGDQQQSEPSRVRKWAMPLLRTLAGIPIGETEGHEWRQRVLQFLMMYSCCHVQRSDKALPLTKQHPKEELSEEESQMMLDCLHKAVGHLVADAGRGKQKSTERLLDTLAQLCELLVALNKSDNVKMLNPVDEETEEHLVKVLRIRTKLKKKTGENERERSEGLQLLLLHLGLQLVSDPASTAPVLEDLYICCDKAFSKKATKTSEDPDWPEVLTELLLSLLAKPSHMTRVVVTSAFGLLLPSLTTAALRRITEVLQSSGADDELGFDDGEEDMEDEDMEENGEDEDGEDDDESEDEEDEEEGSSSEEEEEEKKELPGQLRTAVQKALGKAAAEEEAESDSDSEGMTDEQMFRLDGALSAAFNAQRAARPTGKAAQKDRLKQLAHYKERCLDLVSAVIKYQPSADNLLVFVLPLLELAGVWWADEKEMKSLGERTRHVLSQLRKTKPSKGEPVDKEATVQLMKDLLEHCTSVSEKIPLVVDVAQCFLYAVKLHLGVEDVNPQNVIKPSADKKKKEKSRDGEAEVLDIVRPALTNFLHKRDTRHAPNFFLNLFEKQPSVMWPLREELLAALLDDDVRVFAKTHAASLLSALLNRSVMESCDDQAKAEAARDIVTQASKMLSEFEEDTVKPKLCAELVALLIKVHTTQLCDMAKASDPDLVNALESLETWVKGEHKKPVKRLHSVCTNKASENQKKKQRKKRKPSENAQSTSETTDQPKPKKERKLSENEKENNGTEPQLQSRKRKSSESEGKSGTANGVEEKKSKKKGKLSGGEVDGGLGNGHPKKKKSGKKSEVGQEDGSEKVLKKKKGSSKKDTAADDQQVSKKKKKQKKQKSESASNGGEIVDSQNGSGKTKKH